MLFSKKFKFIFASLSILFPAILLCPATSISAELWTLDKSIFHAIKVSPDIRATDAEVKARQGALKQSGAWPNPSIEFNVNDKLGIDDGSGGSDLTQIAITQPIPLGRLSHQRKQAKARLLVAEQNHFYQQLLLENKTAHNFHKLQLAIVTLKLGKEKLHFAKNFQKQENNNALKNNPIIRYLTPLEVKRLGIIRETATQFVASAEGEYNEVLSTFKMSLKLSKSTKIKTDILLPAHPPASLDSLFNHQNANHAAILAAKYRRKAANTGIALTRAQRFADPTLTLFRERDLLAGSRQNYTGISISIPIPLWNQNKGAIAKARSEAEITKYELQVIQRELRTKLSQSHMHLGYLIDQAKHYRTKILVPAKEVFELTRKGFSVGEVNILSLVDAHNTYFDARERYLELLYESWLAAAELRLTAGLSVMGTKNFNHDDSAGGSL